MDYQYNPRGVCSRSIRFSIRDGKLHDVSFVGGCNGNLKAIGKLVEGMPAEEYIRILKGNTCGMRPTSCTDQLARAVEAALEKENRQNETGADENDR